MSLKRQSISVSNPQNRENRQCPPAQCRLCHVNVETKVFVCYLSVTSGCAEDFFLFKILFIFDSSEGIWRRKRTTVPVITVNASEHRTDCVQSVYNCVSCEPRPPSLLGSHATFPVTLLYTRGSKLIWCISVISLSSLITCKICCVLTFCS